MEATMGRLTKHTDLLAAGAVVLVVLMMIIPLPPALVDLCISLNISAALAILVAALYMPRALDFAAFPSLLLLTTLFRLAINVSVTRLVLLHGDAGHVVKAFGEFVVGGNIVVGLVVFLILVVIQFVVITNGAGRVAEVAARFTLDAMPGKQMAIDADLNAGQITDEEARKRREDIGREADFYGAMDGASKFVKGDAAAGILITAINLLGGVVIGVVMQHRPMSDAVHHFSLLSVGDGLTAQIPALLISVATGILVTRSASEKDLGNDIAGQVLGSKKAPMVAGVVVASFALVPGLPKIPFLVVGGLFAFMASRMDELMPAIAGGGAADADAQAALPAAQEAARPDAVGQLAGVPTTEPAFGIPATWIQDAGRAEAEALGYTVVDRESVIVTHLTESIRQHASDLLTRQEAKQLLDQLKEHNAAVVEEVVPEILSLGEIQRVLQSLLQEGVSIRDLGTIVEAIGDKARLTRDPGVLAEYARQALGRTITAPYLDAERKLRALTLDPALEQEVAESITQT